MLWRSLLAIMIASAIGGSAAPRADDALSGPAAAARAALDLFQRGQMDEFVTLYHPDSQKAHSLADSKNRLRDQYEAMLAHVAELFGFILDTLQVSAEIGEPVIKQDLALVPFELTSPVVSDYLYENEMALKLGPAPGGEGTTWWIWQDGLTDFVYSASQASPNILAFVEGKRHEMNSLIDTQMELEILEKRAKAWQSPKDCADIYLSSLSSGKALFANTLLHPESAAHRKLAELDAKLDGASEAPALYAGSVCQMLYENLALHPKLGDPEIDGDFASVAVTLQSTTSPETVIPFTLEVKKDAEGHWRIWNQEVAVAALEKAAQADHEMQTEVDNLRESLKAQLEAMGIEDVATGEAVSKSPEAAVKSLLEALINGDTGAAERLYHGESAYAKQFAALARNGQNSPETLSKLTENIGSLYKQLFKILWVSWETIETGAATASDEPVEVRLKLKSAIRLDWSPDISISVRLSKTASGEETWAIWESTLLDTLISAVEADATLSEKVRDLRDQIDAAKKELAELGG